MMAGVAVGSAATPQASGRSEGGAPLEDRVDHVVEM
jgi:hypothetical protein